MITDNSDKTSGFFANPLPIVMMVLLSAGVLVNNIQLESARPTDPEHIKFIPSFQQDVEARLWQDPFAAVERYQKSISTGKNKDEKNIDNGTDIHTPNKLNEHILNVFTNSTVKSSSKPVTLTVVAVSVFGDSFVEAAETRRRHRFAVVSALGIHNYYPDGEDSIGYFNFSLTDSKTDSKQVAVPYEWYTQKKSPELHSYILVLWLNESEFGKDPVKKIDKLIGKLSPDEKIMLDVKLVGPTGSSMLTEIVDKLGKAPDSKNQKEYILPNRRGTLKIFSHGATISNCKLPLGKSNNNNNDTLWGCIGDAKGNVKDQLDIPAAVIRTTGTDDSLSALLLWELWQRGVNHEHVFFVNKKKPDCNHGLVLIGEHGSIYARTLTQNLTNGFLSLCEPQKNSSNLVRTFTYLRGLDGTLPDIDKSDTKASHKDNEGKSKELSEQLKKGPLEHAEGRSQYDYLRRLTEEIEELDSNKEFAKNGIKAIGIIGNDIYDKLLILQALRGRFKDKIFFTTDLDARYLHADQKEWARNLLVASNFDLKLHSALQQSTLPFRDSYQTAAYLSTLMALEAEPTGGWNNKMGAWLNPQVFEIGRTEAVHLASPTIKFLTKWNYNVHNKYLSTNFEESNHKDIDKSNKHNECKREHWVNCSNIEPVRPSNTLSIKYQIFYVISSICLIGLIALVSRNVHQKWPVAKKWLFSLDIKSRKILFAGIFMLLILFLLPLLIRVAIDYFIINKYLDVEPFRWLEGVSMWISLFLRYIGFVLTFILLLASIVYIHHGASSISRDYLLDQKLEPPNTLKKRKKIAAMLNGPFFDSASFNIHDSADSSDTKISTLWQTYIRVTSLPETISWILLCYFIACLATWMMFLASGSWPSFPHRGWFVEMLYYPLIFINITVFCLAIFWVSYQSRSCAQFIKMLKNIMKNGNLQWPDEFLMRKEREFGIPKDHLTDYLGFELMRRAAQRIRWLIYLPFVSILFVIIARNDLFDAMDFPLTLVIVIGITLIFALSSEVVLHRCAVTMRFTVLNRYEERLMKILAPQQEKLQPSASAEQIKLLMDRIRNNNKGVFVPIYEQPAIRALLLPFGGFGGAQLMEYFISNT